jgi:hypothetical protein
LPRRREQDLAGLALLSLAADGRLTSWSATAAEMFGLAAAAVLGRDICDVLLTGPGHQDLVRAALARVSSGRIWTWTVAGGSLGEGRFAVRCEPSGAGDGSALVVFQRAWPVQGPGWLTEAAGRIGRTLDLIQTAAEIVDVVVPGFADAAVLYITERLLAADEFRNAQAGSGVVVRRLAARLAGQTEAVAHDLLPPGEVLFLAEGSPRMTAVVTGVPVPFEQLDEANTRRIETRTGLAIHEVAEGYSYLAVPLAARGAVVGCAVFGRARGRGFSPLETTLAAELGSRAALALDNARLYDRERRTAQVLQRGLLPAQPDIPASLEVAHRFLPVGDSVVGGDWYDIVPLPGGRAALIVGDAMGHGPEAAAVMVQLRTAAHILAGREVPPEEILRSLDEIVAGLPGAVSFATCISTVIDPVAGSCLAAQAGHLPPVLVWPGGRTVELDLPTGLPLGLGAKAFDETEVPFPPGVTLALYTDGLVENRSRPLEAGLAALREALAAELSDPARPLDEAADAVAARLREDNEDDITLVLARIRPDAPAGPQPPVP